MEQCIFSALGTRWVVHSDDKPITSEHAEVIFSLVRDFEQRFSRFIPQSEVNAFRDARPGSYPISPLFAELLTRSHKMRELSDGRFDPAVGALLEAAGYDSSYRFSPTANTATFSLPRWQIQGETLILDGPVSFDVGGIGKGYCIDLVSRKMSAMGYPYHIVEAGGDMVVTTKVDGSEYHAAIEWPGKPDMAVGVVSLRNRALAVSDRFRRSWGQWHHIVNPLERVPIQHVVGAVAVAHCAWDADCVTSLLFLASPHQLSSIAITFQADYLVFRADQTVHVSANWPGELF